MLHPFLVSSPLCFFCCFWGETGALVPFQTACAPLHQSVHCQPRLPCLPSIHQQEGLGTLWPVARQHTHKDLASPLHSSCWSGHYCVTNNQKVIMAERDTARNQLPGCEHRREVRHGIIKMIDALLLRYLRVIFKQAGWTFQVAERRVQAVLSSQGCTGLGSQ